MYITFQAIKTLGVKIKQLRNMESKITFKPQNNQL